MRNADRVRIDIVSDEVRLDHNFYIVDPVTNRPIGKVTPRHADDVLFHLKELKDLRPFCELRDSRAVRANMIRANFAHAADMLIEKLEADEGWANILEKIA